MPSARTNAKMIGSLTIFGSISPPDKRRRFPDKNMRTLQEFLPLIRRLGRREAVRWSNGFRTWTATYVDLYGAIGAVANHFEELGITKGNSVLIYGENQFEWIAVFWAC